MIPNTAEPLPVILGHTTPAARKRLDSESKRALNSPSTSSNAFPISTHAEALNGLRLMACTDLRWAFQSVKPYFLRSIRRNASAVRPSRAGPPARRGRFAQAQQRQPLAATEPEGRAAQQGERNIRSQLPGQRHQPGSARSQVVERRHGAQCGGGVGAATPQARSRGNAFEENELRPPLDSERVGEAAGCAEHQIAVSGRHVVLGTGLPAHGGVTPTNDQ